MSLTLLTPPALEPVTVDDLKAHLRVDHGDEDALIAGLGLAARQALEARFGLALIAQSWRLALDRLPHDDLELPMSPVMSVDGVTLNLAGGGITIVDEDDYEAQTGLVGRVRFRSVPRPPERLGAIIVDFKAGWPDPEAVPAEICLAIKVLAAHFYENREAAGIDRFYTSPESINSLMGPWRRVRL